MSLTIEQILAVNDTTPIEVPVPEWSGSVYVRRLSASEALRLSQAIRAIRGDDAHQERMVTALAAYLCDAHGGALATIEQARLIAEKSAAAVNRIAAAGHVANAIDTASAEAASKNSEPSRSASSPTA